jgi:hypothetical protein
MICFALTALGDSRPMENVRVDSVERVFHPAGRLGQRVDETWTVSVDGQKFNVVVSPYHTQSVNESALVHTGDSLTILAATPESDELRITIGQVRR